MPTVIAPDISMARKARHCRGPSDDVHDPTLFALLAGLRALALAPPSPPARQRRRSHLLDESLGRIISPPQSHHLASNAIILLGLDLLGSKLVPAVANFRTALQTMAWAELFLRLLG